ncbi:unnamed protein product [Paramecium octaurelia]|uniref:RING-type domain-containing protein n=1 Tax=Paramecium octaurelia TaxID=43137 RepID=A0A8S1VMS9_PAROT|nr:unnamed protein product [Paramecium octaurelia]
MLQLFDVIKQITSKLRQNKEGTQADQLQNNLILESFLLGYLQGGSLSSKLFHQHLDIFVSLKLLVDCQIINQERLDKLYGDSILRKKDLLNLYKEVQDEIFEILENNQIDQNRKEIFESQWEIIQKPSPTSLNNEQQLAVSAIYQQFRQENEDPEKSLALTIQQIEENNENQLDIECKICFEKIPILEKVILCCSHYFHKSCLKSHYITYLKQQSFPIQCPSGCKQIITFRDLETVLDQPGLQEFKIQYLKTYLSRQKEYSCCPTADCAYFFIAGDNPHFVCPVCDKAYCLECKIEYHNKHSCQEYRDKLMTKSDEAKFQNFVKEANYKQCPNCKVWIEKNKGCDHMICKCKFEFCYNCGGEYNKCKCKNNTYLRAFINFFSLNG